MSLDTDTPRDAVTWFEVRELLDERALLDVRLETGRTHQIRVHLAAVELPVCGDPVYGVAGDLGLGAPVPARAPASLPPPVHRCGRRRDVTSAARSRGGARESPRRRARRLRSTRRRASTRLRPAGQPTGALPLPFHGSCPVSPAGARGRWCRGSAPGSVRARRLQAPSTRSKGAGPVVSRLHEGAPGGRSAFRPPDAPLEPEDAALHLHRAVRRARRPRRHLHHRPPADAGTAPGGARLRAQPRRAPRRDPVRRHEEAGAGRRQGARDARRHAVRLQPLARRAAHELAHDRRPHRVPPRAAAAEDGRPARAAPRQGAHRDGERAREARGEPRRRRGHEAPAGRGVHRRPAQGAARGARGSETGPAGDRARRHELRPGRGDLRDPWQRRRHPLVLAHRARGRRRHRRRPDEGVGRRARTAGRAEAERRPSGGTGRAGGRAERPRRDPAEAPAEEAQPVAVAERRRGWRALRDGDRRQARQAAPRPHRRGDDGVQARAAGDRRATSTPRSPSCARRAWPQRASAPTAPPAKVSSA